MNYFNNKIKMLETVVLRLQIVFPLVVRQGEISFQKLSWSEKAGIIQAMMAAISVIILIITVILQFRTVKDQKEVLILERKAKAAEYFPQIFSRSIIKQPQELDIHKRPFNIDLGMWSIEMALTIKQNPIVSFSYKIHSNTQNLYVDESESPDINRIFAIDEVINLNFKFSLADQNAFDITRATYLDLIIFFSDQVGNKYTETFRQTMNSVVYTLGTKVIGG